MNTYQGWTNRETWAVKLWMDNDEPLYRWAQEGTKGARSAFDLADTLKDALTEQAPELDGLWGDLLTGAMQDVNWLEIAESLIEDNED